MYKQEQLVWNYLKRYGKITSLVALNKLGVMDLPKRISNLVKDKYKIDRSNYIMVKNRFGEKCRVKEYRLLKGV